METRQFKENSLIFYSKIQSLFKLTKEENEIYSGEIFSENIRKAFYLSLAAIFVSLIHIALFASKLQVVSGIELQWVNSIIYTHLSLFAVSTFSAIFLYFSVFHLKKNRKSAGIYTHALLLFILFLGSVLTAFDQRVTPAITPFINATILISLLFQIRPSMSVIYYSVSYFVYYFAISQTQLKQEILISNLVNGITITVIGMSLSVILWRLKLTRILQREQIKKQNKALFDSNAEKDKFFSIIAHDLKNPFNSILGFSNLIIEQLKVKNYDAIDMYAKIINQSTNSALDLLMNLMDWTRAHTGRMEFNPGNIDLNRFIIETEYLFAATLKQKNISLKHNIPEKTVVYADENMIRTILRNLISNAIKFTHPEGQIVLDVIQNQNECLITVKDSGVGIPKESLDMLFRLDQNKSTKGTQNETGTGLGLILCKELIEKHNGRIWVESEPGKGSTFHISIPGIAQIKE